MMVRHLFIALIAFFYLAESLEVSADVVAAKTLRKGKVLNASDLNATAPKSEALKDSLIGSEIKRSVYVGRLVNIGDVGPITVVYRNDIVNLVFSSKGLGIRTEARALASGGVGETIQVMNMDTRVTVTARVIGAKRAEAVR